MKDQVQGKLVEILTGIQTAVGKASDFAIEQLPDIAMQYITWGRVSESVYILIFITVLILSFLVARWGFKHRDSCEEVHGIACLMGGAATLGSGILILANLSSLLMVWFAPKVWLIKELARMVR
jgi:hypothetical protein